MSNGHQSRRSLSATRAAKLRRRRMFLIVLILVLGTLLVIRHEATQRGRTTSPTTTAHSTAVSSTTTTAVDKGPYGVGIVTNTLTEPKNLLCAPHGALSGCVVRTMPLYIRYPTTGPLGQEVNGAKPYFRGGPYPLIVFGNGYLETPSNYATVLDYWVSQGYVVASPEFPLSQPSSVGGPWESDILNEPGDMSAALGYVSQLSDSPSSRLFGLVDTSEVAFAGQSDGADVAVAASYNTCCIDSRVKAVISLSGAELPSFPGKYFTHPGPPLLVVQGTEDEINVPTDSDALYQAAGNPKYYLSLIGASHMDEYQGTNSYSVVVQKVSTAFLNYYLKAKQPSLAEMGQYGNVPGIASLR